MSALALDMRITSFPDVSGSRRATTWMSLGMFAGSAIAQASAPDKASLPLLKLACFGDRRSTKGSLRHDRNVLEISGVELDYDGEALSLDRAAAILKAARLPAVVYSSPSHTPTRPRWRILAPFSTPRPPDMRAQMVSRVAGLLPVEMAPESWTLSQAYYYGSIANQPPVVIIEVDGDDFVAVDLRDDLDAGARPKPGKGNGADGPADDWFDPGPSAADEDALRTRVAEGGQATHDALVRLCGLLAQRGSTEPELIVALAEALQQRPLERRNPDWHKHLSEVRNIVAWVLRQEHEKPAETDPWNRPQPQAKEEPEEVEAEPDEWPEPSALAAFHGPIGEAVAAIMPHTEADPHGLLLQLLTFFGNKIGRGPHYRVNAAKHATNLYVILAGATSRSRKGTSESDVRALLSNDAQDSWLSNCIAYGLSSGEGLIHAVRDERWGQNKKGELELIEAGVTDKRLLVIESEFASTLAVMKREGSTLSAVLRVGWDRGDLQTLTRNAPLRATGALISVVGQITVEELRSEVDRIALANGLLNRFLFVAVRRARLLPFGGSADPAQLEQIGERLAAAARAAALVGAIGMTAEAAELWSSVYPQITTDKQSLLGALIARGEAHTVRLALIYALADQATAIALPHLQAAFAVWKYSEDSARVLFGSLVGDPIADALLHHLRLAGKAGVTRTELYNALGRNVSSARVQAALTLLAQRGRARRTRGRSPDRGSGPFVETWFYLSGGARP